MSAQILHFLVSMANAQTTNMYTYNFQNLVSIKRHESEQIELLFQTSCKLGWTNHEICYHMVSYEATANIDETKRHSDKMLLRAYDDTIHAIY